MIHYGRFYKVKAFLYFIQELAQSYFYVTDGNIMYLTDASRFLISCVIQHYAPVALLSFFSVGGGTDA